MSSNTFLSYDFENLGSRSMLEGNIWQLGEKVYYMK